MVMSYVKSLTLFCNSALALYSSGGSFSSSSKSYSSTSGGLSPLSGDLSVGYSGTFPSYYSSSSSSSFPSTSDLFSFKGETQFYYSMEKLKRLIEVYFNGSYEGLSAEILAQKIKARSTPAPGNDNLIKELKKIEYDEIANKLRPFSNALLNHSYNLPNPEQIKTISDKVIAANEKSKSVILSPVKALADVEYLLSSALEMYFLIKKM